MKRKNISAITLTGLIFVALVTACSFFGPSATKKAAPDELFFVSKMKDDNKTIIRGFMDKTGKIVLGPWESFEWNGKKYGGDSFKSPYFAVFPFIEGLAGICFYEETSVNVYNEIKPDLEKGKCGFIDKTGKIVIEPKYKQIGYFSEGLAAVSEESDKYSARFGYIDRTGKMVIEPKFTSKSVFSDGLAAVTEITGEASNKTVKHHYIDQTGKFVFEHNYGFLGSFADGHTIVGLSNGGIQKIIIDKTGKAIKTLETESAGNTDYYYQTSIISRFNQGYAVDEIFTMPAFNEGLTMIYDRGRAFPIGFVNTRGELEIRLDPQLVGQIRPFSEGFAPVGWRFVNEEKKKRVHGFGAPADVYDWTFVDRKGNVKIDLENTFREARPFAEGLAAVQSRADVADGRWGFINPEFKSAVPFCFEKVNDFRAGLALVFLVEYANEKKGCERYGAGSGGSADRNFYIDKNGNVVKPQW